MSRRVPGRSCRRPLTSPPKGPRRRRVNHSEPRAGGGVTVTPLALRRCPPAPLLRRRSRPALLAPGAPSPQHLALVGLTAPGPGTRKQAVPQQPTPSPTLSSFWRVESSEFSARNFDPTSPEMGSTGKNKAVRASERRADGLEVGGGGVFTSSLLHCKLSGNTRLSLGRSLLRLQAKSGEIWPRFNRAGE